MIWAFEYLNTKQLIELEWLNPLMDFRFDVAQSKYYWKTFCAGFQNIYENPSLTENSREKTRYYDIPVDLIDFYPDENSCVDNVPEISDSYEYIMEGIRRGTILISALHPVHVTPSGNRFLTIDKSRVKAYQDAASLGHDRFKTIPAAIVKSLRKEIRRIRLFRLGQTKQGFICDVWEEARMLSMYMSGIDTTKQTIEGSYKWIPDYLSLRKDNRWLDMIAMPVAEYMNYFVDNESALERVDIQSLMERN